MTPKEKADIKLECLKLAEKACNSSNAETIVDAARILFNFITE